MKTIKYISLEELKEVIWNNAHFIDAKRYASDDVLQRGELGRLGDVIYYLEGSEEPVLLNVSTK